MSVAGQTQALLGTGVLVFSVMAYYGSAWAGIAAGAIGVALVVTGMIGWCPIQSALRQMPWNQKPQTPANR